MKLRQIANSTIQCVNQDVYCVIHKYTGTTTLPSGKRVPAYAPPITLKGQLQAVTNSDLQRLEGLNITGITKILFLKGNFRGVDRVNSSGGDVIEIDGETWLITQVIEEWPDWCKLIITMQLKGVRWT